jgi:hypothetical protein
VTPVCEKSLPLVKPIRRRCEWPLPDSKNRSQLFIGMHNKPLSVVAMCVSNPDRLSQFPEWFRAEASRFKRWSLVASL